MARKTHTDPVALTARLIREKVTIRPLVALVLGSGLSRFADRLSVSHTIDTADLPHYPRLSIEGHPGRLHFGTIRHKSRRSAPLLVFQGRVHFYESGSLDLTTFPIDLAHRLGARVLVVTNAAGGINRKFSAGDFMLIDDLLSLSFLNVKKAKTDPLRAAVRIFRRSDPPFDPQLQLHALKSARELGLPLQRGVYCWLKGPSYETPAEIEMLSRMGVDAVGMSTVPEVVRAIDHGMRVLGISVISNMAAGIQQGKLSHSEVTETTRRVGRDFEDLMASLLLAIK